ncbi:phosphatidic acid phosphatase [Pikeienuella piscinae]|uniref:Phosphatidic acid phosphatase n=1 Tax=Pikeienuella piscinae TaxID=2748098 RepID=A0A7L5BWJ4_9RHOB|nr:phosphatidic acid phosphatase [Pikeienuella piscinae]QIE55523.1 phosphatidic acid phosphatase [Pikeienuella piscinae]
MNPEAGFPTPDGQPRSYWATPWELRRRPWALDFAANDAGAVSFPLEFKINPYRDNGDALEWRTEDWDPALRYWDYPFDPGLTEWLKTVDATAPAIRAAREFAGCHHAWHPWCINFHCQNWIRESDLTWWPYELQTISGQQAKKPVRDTSKNDEAWTFIKTELERMRFQMEDERLIYLDEADAQADGIHDYLIHFIGADGSDHPWTIELIRTGLSIGNLVYLAYKSYFNRVRPSFLMPGLAPPFGPPEHPAFPSGHSFLGHFIALLLLEIPGIHQRLGVFDSLDGAPGRRPEWEDVLVSATLSLPPPPKEDEQPKKECSEKKKEQPVKGVAPPKGTRRTPRNGNSPLLRIAERLAVNRERIGVHYRSDTTGGRHLAAGVWDALMPVDVQGGNPNRKPIPCPTLLTTLDRAKAEWPTLWQAVP